MVNCIMNTQVSQNCLAEAKMYPDAFQGVCPSFSVSLFQCVII